MSKVELDNIPTTSRITGRDTVEQLIKEQKTLTYECFKGIESSKLTLWKLKADLGTFSCQIKRFNRDLEEIEDKVAHLRQICNKQARYCKQCCDNLAYYNSHTILDISSPWPILQDVALCVQYLLGYDNGNWLLFKKLVRQNKGLKQMMLNFIPDNVQRLDQIAHMIKKHNLENCNRDKRLPEEFFSLVDWVCSAYTYIIKQQDCEQYFSKVQQISHKKSKAYMQWRQVQDVIEETENSLKKLYICIEQAEINIQKLSKVKSQSKQQIQSILLECEKTDLMAKSSIKVDSILLSIMQKGGLNYNQESDEENLDAKSLKAQSITQELKEELSKIINQDDDCSGYIERTSQTPISVENEAFSASKGLFYGKQQDAQPDISYNNSRTQSKISNNKSNKRKCCGFV